MSWNFVRKQVSVNVIYFSEHMEPNQVMSCQKITNLTKHTLYMRDNFITQLLYLLLTGGHYTAYGQNYINAQWYEFDDQYVTEVDIQQVENCEAYVLFYR